MRSNASIFAALLLLAGCGGGRGHADYAPEMAGPPPMGSVAAQSWSSSAGPAPSRGAASQADPRQSYGDQPAETWRAADGTLRSRPAPARPQPEPQPQWTEPARPAPDAGYAAPGASYAQPGSASAPPQQQEQLPPPAAPQQAYADPAPGASGPRGSSQAAPGEVRYDEIGYAGVRPVSGAMDAAVVAAHRSLPPNSYVEVTSLDTGRTILVLVTGALGPGADHPIDLSAGAARLLGASGGTIPVRVRTVNPPPMDRAALTAGRPAADRPDAPQVLLTALRKRLPGTPGFAAAARPTAPAYAPPRATSAPPRPVPAARIPAGRGYLVQIAALSVPARAQALAQSMGGFVKPGGGLYRVQLGPFATAGEAEAARRRAAGAGYGDARVLAN